MEEQEEPNNYAVNTTIYYKADGSRIGAATCADGSSLARTLAPAETMETLVTDDDFSAQCIEKAPFVASRFPHLLQMVTHLREGRKPYHRLVCENGMRAEGVTVTDEDFQSLLGEMTDEQKAKFASTRSAILMNEFCSTHTAPAPTPRPQRADPVADVRNNIPGRNTR